MSGMPTRTTDEPGVQRAVERLRLRMRRRARWLQALWAERPADAPEPPPAGDDREAERRFHAADETSRALASALEAVEQGGAAPTLARLAEVFGLDRREADCVEACLALELDPSLGRSLAILADHAARTYLTESAVARLYDHGLARALVPESPLARWRLVRAEPVAPGEPDALSIDPLVRDWLVGQRRLDAALVGVARLVPPLEPLPRWPLAETAAWIGEELASGGRARVCLIGAPGSGRRTFAASVVQRLGLPLLAVDADAVDADAWPAVVLAAHRQAYLDGCALAWCGETAWSRRWPEVPAAFPVQFLVGDVGAAAPPCADMVDRVVEMPGLEVAERATLWRAHVRAADAWPEDEVAVLAAHHRVTAGEIRAIAARRPADAADAARLVREAARHRLGELARWMESPFTWDDLVVPAVVRDALQDLVYEARHRATFWERAPARRLFPQGRGLFALFTGPPGAGKTMAAQVVAASLGLDLFRISLASVVSKYVGETSKNLQRVLARGEETDAVLLFDEADALFGKRTEIKDAHDRFANTDTNYLLQAIEGYRGIVILASNKKANIDVAFTRRLRWVIDFPRPDAAQRRQLWERLVGELAGASAASALARSLDLLADTVEVTGAQVKYAMLSAMFAAQREGAPLAVRHLVRGLDRELLKEGRALSDRDRERIAHA